MRKLIIVDGLPVIKQLEKFDKNRNFVEVALIFLKKKRDIERFFEEFCIRINKVTRRMFTERMKRIGRKNLRLNKNDKEFIKWETVDNVETILLTYNTHCFKSRFFQKFKKFLGKKFDKARVEIKTFEEIYKT